MFIYQVYRNIFFMVIIIDISIMSYFQKRMEFLSIRWIILFLNISLYISNCNQARKFYERTKGLERENTKHGIRCIAFFFFTTFLKFQHPATFRSKITKKRKETHIARTCHRQKYTIWKQKNEMKKLAMTVCVRINIIFNNLLNAKFLSRKTHLITRPIFRLINLRAAGICSQ